MSAVADDCPPLPSSAPQPSCSHCPFGHTGASRASLLIRRTCIPPPSLVQGDWTTSAYGRAPRAACETPSRSPVTGSYLGGVRSGERNAQQLSLGAGLGHGGADGSRGRERKGGGRETLCRFCTRERRCAQDSMHRIPQGTLTPRWRTRLAPPRPPAALVLSPFAG